MDNLMHQKYASVFMFCINLCNGRYPLTLVMSGNPRTVLTSRSDTWLNVDDASTAGIRSFPENKESLVLLFNVGPALIIFWRFIIF